MYIYIYIYTYISPATAPDNAARCTAAATRSSAASRDTRLPHGS